ncbi:PucR family transcriptional regulator [Marinilactibacillus kalidii]|uniref:PucR family transcriptional regulator n=1 Tax=Marinilactibacillus kalidii TaxID=2820274 RepID=UPI001ABE0731|nr:PucR family transcriptional regulator [Marinilactibacillus kalidii]
MYIKDLLELDLLDSAKVLTGQIGLDNLLESVMVLEAIDIEKWSKKNQLILTSFYALSHESEETVRAFFEKMSKIGVSGLIIKVDRFIVMIPTWVIELGIEYGIPLIKVSKEVSYEAIMLSVYEPIINHQSHLLRTYYDVRQRFMKLERNLSSFDQIMQEFYQLIGKSCSLTIPSLDVAIHLGNTYTNYVMMDASPMKNIPFTKNRYEYLKLFSHEHNQQITAIKVAIINSHTENCTLLVYQKNKEIAESKMMIIENVIDVIYEHLQMEYIIKKDRFTRLNNLADAILQNNSSNLKELTHLLEEADMNQFDYFQGIAFSSDMYEDHPHKQEILSKLRELKTRHIFFEHLNYFIILYNIPNPNTAVTKAKAATIFDHLHLEKNKDTIAISRVKSKADLKEILHECQDIFKFNRQFYIASLLGYDDLGIFGSFVRENQLEKIDQIVPDSLYQLWENDPDLFETLYTFFQSNRNFKVTAETLFLHSKTIRYRLNKIEKNLGIDLTNPIQLVNYEIGTYLLQLKKRSQFNEL